MKTRKSKSLVTVPSERIEEIILLIRGEKVNDFMFRLTPEEFNILMLQNATSKKGRGGRRKLPYAFTEHGALMAANVLNSERAIKVSVQLIRAFIKLRQMLAANSELASKLNNLEERYDHQFKIVFDAIRRLMTPTPANLKPIGFRPPGPKK
jgi:phage regulator Rha-like protein